MTTNERSVDCGKTESLAFKRAPEASWISLMRAPPLPMMLPMRIDGISSLRGYVLDVESDGSARGSLLSVRIIKPKAW